MTENNDDTDTGDKGESAAANSEERRKTLSEALGEGVLQKSGEANDDEGSTDTEDYEDGYIPTRFRSESRETGERRARETTDSNGE